jgi:hypothetical protein
MIILVIIRATGVIRKGVKKHLEAIQGKHSIDSVQRTGMLGTSHIIRKVLQSQTWNLSSGFHYWFKRSTKKKRPVTREKKK